jgi:hypothetical protein
VAALKVNRTIHKFNLEMNPVKESLHEDI